VCNEPRCLAVSGAEHTSLSGPFFTGVTEVEVESLAAWAGSFREATARPWTSEWSGRMMPLVESGSREFDNVVEELPR
jgi:hypothetical protein